MATFDELIRDLGQTVKYDASAGSSSINTFSTDLASAIINQLTSNLTIELRSASYIAEYDGEFSVSAASRIKDAIANGETLFNEGTNPQDHVLNWFGSDNEDFYKQLQEKAEYTINLTGVEVLRTTLINDNNDDLKKILKDAGAISSAPNFGVEFDLQSIKDSITDFIKGMKLDVRGNTRTKGEIETEVLKHSIGSNQLDLPQDASKRNEAISILRENLNKLKSEGAIYAFSIQTDSIKTTVETTFWETAEYEAEFKIKGVR